MRVRVRFAKTGKLRYISAIDLGRVWERALRKADLAIAYSEGFSPHPKVGYGDALPLGLASQAEYAELTFAVPVRLDDMTARLNAAFPDGLAVLDAVESPDGDARLGKLLQASLWALDYASAEGLAEAVDALPASGPLEVTRERKGEDVTVDLSPLLAGLHVEGMQVRGILRHPGFVPDGDGNERGARPDDIHSILGIGHPPVLITRLAQGRVTDVDTHLGIAEALRGTAVPLAPDARLAADHA